MTTQRPIGRVRARARGAITALLAAVMLAACGTGATSTSSPAGSASTPTSSSGDTQSDPAASPTNNQAATVALHDQWGRDVTVPVDPKRVVVIEWEGLVVKSMGAFGVADRIVGVDKPTTQQQFRRTIIPALANAQDVGTAFSGLNIEQIAGLEPDVVFLEAWASSDESRELHQGIIDRLDALQIPTVVFLSPSNFPEPDLSTAWEIISMTGQVFGKEAQAQELVESITSRIDEITARIPKDVTAPTAVIFASINYIMGVQSIQATMLTEILGAKNLAGEGTFIPISEEKLLALDPEVLLVIGHEGYISAEEINAGENVGLNWSALGSLQALQNDRLATLGYDEWRATVETPVALMKMAKVLYPEAFADVDVEQYEIDFYQEFYGLDEASAKVAIQGQHFRGEL